MRIFVDADASPVQNEVIDAAKAHDLQVVFVKNYAHFSQTEYPSFVEVIHVDKGADMADYEIVRNIQTNDIVITQDYGLAALCLGKQAHVLHHKGFVYTNDNIDRLLDKRHLGAQMRRAGMKTKGPKPFTEDERTKFVQILHSTIITYKNYHHKFKIV